MLSGSKSTFSFILGPSTKILVTGGGSVNRSILQIIADVFNAPVFTQVSEYWSFFGLEAPNLLLDVIRIPNEAVFCHSVRVELLLLLVQSAFFQAETKNSAALGAAYRARHALLGGERAMSFSQSLAGKQTMSTNECIQPHKDAKSVKLVSILKGFQYLFYGPMTSFFF